ncbi:hypothetical protein L596_019647 [Steinernema carpocapsae]|uniref:Uncharacterized protein n=1 Tax=Steinernema carpocapsae TaxID=34508 RepID=A0A4V6A0N5_STECR|nr:hypothetical protein L596_019647 [Steinernema carpocapsae]
MIKTMAATYLQNKFDTQKLSYLCLFLGRSVLLKHATIEQLPNSWKELERSQYIEFKELMRTMKRVYQDSKPGLVYNGVLMLKNKVVSRRIVSRTVTDEKLQFFIRLHLLQRLVPTTQPVSGTEFSPPFITHNHINPAYTSIHPSILSTANPVTMNGWPAIPTSGNAPNVQGPSLNFANPALNPAANP